MGNRPIEIFLFCDPEDTPLASALSAQLSANGVVSSYGHDLADKVDRCQAVAVCVVENSRSLAPGTCALLQNQLASQGFRVLILFLPNAYPEDVVWLPKDWVQFTSENDPAALQALIG